MAIGTASSQENLKYALRRGVSLARVSSWIHSGGTGVAPTPGDYTILGISLANESIDEFNASLSETNKSPTPQLFDHASMHEAPLFANWAKNSAVGQSLYDQRSLSLAKIASFASASEIPLDPSLIPSEQDYQNAGLRGIFDDVHGQGLGATIGQVNATLRALSPAERNGLVSMADALVEGMVAGDDKAHPVFEGQASLEHHIPLAHPGYATDTVVPESLSGMPIIPSVLSATVIGSPGNAIQSHSMLRSLSEGHEQTIYGTGIGHAESLQHVSGMPSIPSVLPAIPTEFPAIPTVLPAIPKDFPAIPSVLPGIPNDIPGVPTAGFPGHASDHSWSSSGSVDGAHNVNGMPAIPTVLPTIPSEHPTIPSVIPAIPIEMPAIPSVIPQIPGFSAGGSMMSGDSGLGSTQGKVDLMSLLGGGRHVLVANIDGMSYPIFSDKSGDGAEGLTGTPDQAAVPVEGALHPGHFQPPYEQDSWRYHFG
jgi:hypothetical protein